MAIRFISVFTCRRPILHPSAASRPRNMREPAQGNCRCSRSRRRITSTSLADTGRGTYTAVYALVQTALVQDEALKRANARLEELQAQTACETQQQGGFLDSVRDAVLGKREPQGSVPSVRSQAQSSPTAAPPYRPRPGEPPQRPPYPPGPGLAPGMGSAFG